MSKATVQWTYLVSKLSSIPRNPVSVAEVDLSSVVIHSFNRLSIEDYRIGLF